jgi:hypothetical protein
VSLFATIVDWEALLETCLAALVAGVGVAFTFSLAILGSARFLESSRDGRRAQSLAFATLALLGVAATGVAIAGGIIAMTSG